MSTLVDHHQIIYLCKAGITLS